MKRAAPFTLKPTHALHRLSWLHSLTVASFLPSSLSSPSPHPNPTPSSSPSKKTPPPTNTSPASPSAPQLPHPPSTSPSTSATASSCSTACDSNPIPISSSFLHRLPCIAPQCSLIQTPFACTDNTSSCAVLVNGPAVSTVGGLAQALLFARSTDGSNYPGPTVTTSNFTFTCAPSSPLQGLARGARRIAGFGRNRIGLPIQQASFIYTPLFVNPVSTAGSYVEGEKSVEYFIGVTSIKVIDIAVPLNATLLSIDKHGNGGTKISTVTPYTTMETSIYKAVAATFALQMSALDTVPSVGKFGSCYKAKDIARTRVGPGVPQIDLVLQSESVYWRIFGANSMVEAKPGVLCLAFVDGGEKPRTSIVIGAHQLEDNLLQFDLKNGRLGFTSSLLSRRTTCANFNFTSSKP